MPLQYLARPLDVLVIGNPALRSTLRWHTPPEYRTKLLSISSLFAGWDGSRLHVVEAETLRSIDTYDAVCIFRWGSHRSMARLVAWFLTERKIPSLNTQLFDTWPVTKIAELCRLTTAGLPHPRTLSTPLCQNLPQLFRWGQEKLGFSMPVVVKAIGASHGNFNYKVEDESRLIPQDRRWTYAIQEFIPNRGDYRIVIIGGRPAVAIWRQRGRPDTHLNNTGAGGRATLVNLSEVPPVVLLNAVRAAEAMGRSDLSGVDVVVHQETNQAYVLEVNMNPDIVVGAQDGLDVGAKIRAVFRELSRRVEVQRDPSQPTPVGGS